MCVYMCVCVQSTSCTNLIRMSICGHLPWRLEVFAYQTRGKKVHIYYCWRWKTTHQEYDYVWWIMKIPTNVRYYGYGILNLNLYRSVFSCLLANAWHWEAEQFYTWRWPGRSVGPGQLQKWIQDIKIRKFVFIRSLYDHFKIIYAL